MEGNNILKKSIDVKDKYKEKYWSLIFNHARIDVTIRTVKNNVIGFSVNLSLLEDDGRFDIIRWDTSHWFLHKHEFWRTHRTIKVKQYLEMPLDLAFGEVYADIKRNWMKYIERWKNARKNTG